jgi:signal transduction histidine kinase
LDSGLALSIADDGVGWAEQEQGVGLRAMRERVEEVGGTVSVVVNEDGGLTVRIWVPAT